MTTRDNRKIKETGNTIHILLAILYIYIVTRKIWLFCKMIVYVRCVRFDLNPFDVIWWLHHPVQWRHPAHRTQPTAEIDSMCSEWSIRVYSDFVLESAPSYIQQAANDDDDNDGNTYFGFLPGITINLAGSPLNYSNTAVLLLLLLLLQQK